MNGFTEIKPRKCVLRRLYLAVMLWFVGRAIQAAARTDRAVGEEFSAMPEGYTLEKAEVDFTKGTEEDFIESLRVWAKVLLDGMFPEAISTEQYMKQMPMIGEKLAQSGLSEDEAEKLSMTLPRGMFFLQLLEIGDKYHYAGKGVKLGEGDKAIFWYRPEGADFWIGRDHDRSSADPEDYYYAEALIDNFCMGHSYKSRHEVGGSNTFVPPQRFFDSCHRHYPYFTRLDLRPDRGRRPRPEMAPAADPTEEVRR